MATKKAETKEEKDTTRKKVATGNTEKIVKKRSSSVTNKETTSKKTTTTKKQGEPKKTSKTTTKTSNPKTTKAEEKTQSKAKSAKGSKKTDSKAKTTKSVKEERTVSNSKEKKNEKTEKTKNKKSKIKATENLEVDIEKVQKVIEKEAKSKKISKEDLNKINKRVFQNVILAIIVMFYLNFIILGFINIKNNVFLVDLKVFSMSILAIAIGVLEYAYKKDSGIYAIYGIEVLVLSLVTIGFIYLDIMYKNKFIPIAMLVAYIFSIYYIAKSIIIYIKLKKQYSINNLKEIIKKKED